MPQATLPVAGRQYNLDALLGKDGIVGIKTGSTSQAGACFLFAAHEQLGGRTVTVVGSVLHQMQGNGQPSIIASAFSASTALLASVRPVVETQEVARRHTTIAFVNTPWAAGDAVAATHGVRLVGWPGLRIRETVLDRAPSRRPALRRRNCRHGGRGRGGRARNDSAHRDAAASAGFGSWRLQPPLAVARGSMKPKADRRAILAGRSQDGLDELSGSPVPAP